VHLNFDSARDTMYTSRQVQEVTVLDGARWSGGAERFNSAWNNITKLALP